MDLRLQRWWMTQQFLESLQEHAIRQVKEQIYVDMQQLTVVYLCALLLVAHSITALPAATIHNGTWVSELLSACVDSGGPE